MHASSCVAAFRGPGDLLRARAPAPFPTCMQLYRYKQCSRRSHATIDSVPIYYKLSLPSHPVTVHSVRTAFRQKISNIDGSQRGSKRHGCESPANTISAHIKAWYPHLVCMRGCTAWSARPLHLVVTRPLDPSILVPQNSQKISHAHTGFDTGRAGCGGCGSEADQHNDAGKGDQHHQGARHDGQAAGKRARVHLCFECHRCELSIAPHRSPCHLPSAPLSRRL